MIIHLLYSYIIFHISYYSTVVFIIDHLLFTCYIHISNFIFPLIHLLYSYISFHISYYSPVIFISDLLLFTYVIHLAVFSGRVGGVGQEHEGGAENCHGERDEVRCWMSILIKSCVIHDTRFSLLVG